MSAETLIALVYRSSAKTRCRQYPFHSFEALEEFCARKPYCNEDLIVIPVLEGMCLGRSLVKAECVVDFVIGARAAVESSNANAFASSVLVQFWNRPRRCV